MLVALIVTVVGAGVLVQASDSIDEYGCVNNHEIINSIPSSDVITVLIPIGLYVIKNTDEGQEIFIDNFGRLSKPGEPCLPSRIFSIAIPPKAELFDIIYDVGESIILTGNGGDIFGSFHTYRSCRGWYIRRISDGIN